MKSDSFDIPGPLLLTPDVFRDDRGYFLETFQAARYSEILGLDSVFVQDNMSYSTFGTIRGLHFQRAPFEQAKLVRCVWGRILDVAVDIRHGSPTFGKYIQVELTGEDMRQFYIPRGFAHGFSVLSPEAIVEYKCDAYYRQDADGGVIYNDSVLNIEWQIPAEKVNISAKDANLPKLAQLLKGI